MVESNPRYPHWCRITRQVVEDPMEDEEAVTPFEGDYDPMGDDDENVNDNGTNKSIAEDTETEENTEEGSKTTVIYEGECRSYKVNTTSDRGEVVTSQRGLALPLNQDGWDELGVVPREGDAIVVIHGKTHEEYGRIVDKNVANASFSGTHLIWKYGRN